MKKLLSLLTVATMLVGCSAHDGVGFDAVYDMADGVQKISESDADYDRRQHLTTLDLPLLNGYTDTSVDLRWAQYSSDAELLSISIGPGLSEDGYEYLHVGHREGNRLGNLGYDEGGAFLNLVNVKPTTPPPLWEGQVKLSRKGIVELCEALDWRISYVPAVHRSGVYLGNNPTANVQLRSIELRDRNTGQVYWSKAFAKAAPKAAD